MTISQAAKSLGLSEHTVRNQARAGRLRASRHGRDWWIEESEVERYRRESLGKRAGAKPDSAE